MTAAENSFRNHYLDELQALRTEGLEFAENHPDVARELGFAAESWKDPQAEMLAQCFAFLTARLHNQLDVDRAAIPNALLETLYPSLQAPIPCMSVLSAEVVVDLADGRPIERGRVLSIEAESGKRKAVCRFQNCYDTPIWPLHIETIESVEAKDVEAMDANIEVEGVLKVRLQSDSSAPIQDLPIGESGLRFYIPQGTGSSDSSRQLYELLRASLYGVVVVSEGKRLGEMLSPDCITWRGFADAEAALPDAAIANPSYRLMQEYFAFPEKFMFFDIEQIDVESADQSLDIFLLFSDSLHGLTELNHESLKLNCFPAVNLYEQAIEPIRVTGRKYEYPIEADRSNRAVSEVYQVKELHSIVSGKVPVTIAPCYELSAFDADYDNEYFYSFRRESTYTDKIPGTRSYISLLDLNMNISNIPAEAIGGRVLCTNRRLPEKLFMGNRFTLEGAGPIAGARVLSKVTEYRAPQLNGNAPWQMVSRLTLNFISLIEKDGDREGQGLDALKSILRVYTDTRNQLNWKQINSLKSIKTQRVARMIQDRRSSGIAQGFEITLRINENDFKGISPLLFASVCRYFFALYIGLGSFVELVLIGSKERGEWMRWPPMAGALVDL